MIDNDERYRALRNALAETKWKQIPLGYVSPVYDFSGHSRQYRVEMFSNGGKKMLVLASAWWMEPIEKCGDLTVSIEVPTNTIEEIAALAAN
jgi:hypothetical protein